MTDSEDKAPIIVPLSKNVGTRATTPITGSWRSRAPGPPAAAVVCGCPTHPSAAAGCRVEKTGPRHRGLQGGHGPGSPGPSPDGPASPWLARRTRARVAGPLTGGLSGLPRFRRAPARFGPLVSGSPFLSPSFSAPTGRPPRPIVVRLSVVGKLSPAPPARCCRAPLPAPPGPLASGSPAVGIPSPASRPVHAGLSCPAPLPHFREERVRE